MLKFIGFLVLVSLIPLSFAEQETDAQSKADKLFEDIKRAHSIATNYMINSSSTDRIPIIFAAPGIDHLAIGISPEVLSQNITYTEQQIQQELGVQV